MSKPVYLSWRYTSQEAITKTYVASSTLGQEQEMWMLREGTKPNLGKNVVKEGFQEEVLSELCFEVCVGVSQAGK